MGNRHADWFRQAEADLRHGLHAAEAGDHDWACFASHQAAEKAVKALYLKMEMEAWGHTVTGLLGSLADRVPVPAEILSAARGLDKHYIPTRYPNGFDSGAPVDYYAKEDAEKALRQAEGILGFCKNLIG